ncbi:MAG: hypothetical protein K6V97_12125 [Actinomycetia bacterium]|nr:hypothetical protein [Actinomycetes bacterium]
MTCAYCGTPMSAAAAFRHPWGRFGLLLMARGGRPHPKVVPFRAPSRKSRDRSAPPRRPAPRDYVRWIWAALLIVALLLPYLWHS